MDLNLAISGGALIVAVAAFFSRGTAMKAVDFEPPKVKMRQCEHCDGDGNIRVRGMRTVTGFDTCACCGGMGEVVDDSMEAFGNQQMSQQIADEHQALEDLCVAHGMTPGGLCMEWLDATLRAGLKASLELRAVNHRITVDLASSVRRLKAAEGSCDADGCDTWGAVVSALRRVKEVNE